MARPDRRAGTGAGAGQRLGLRPRPADPAAGDPPRRRRPRRRPPARSNTNSGRSPAWPAATSPPSTPKPGARTASTSACPTVKSGPQPVCVYALDIGAGDGQPARLQLDSDPGRDHPLQHPRQARGGAVRIACDWPAGDRLPGPAGLRTHQGRAAPPPRPPPGPARQPLPRPPPLPPQRRARPTPSGCRSAPGPRCSGQRGQLRAQLVAAIPGGRRVRFGPSAAWR